MQLRLVENFAQFMILTHIFNKTLLTKPLFKEEISFDFIAQ